MGGVTVPVAAVDVSGDAEPHISEMVVRESARHQLTSPIDQLRYGRPQRRVTLYLPLLEHNTEHTIAEV